MRRFARVVAVAAALAWALCACSGGSSMQTVGDATDALASRRTDSQNARDGINAANALGSRVRQIAVLGIDDAWNNFRVGTRTGMVHDATTGCMHGVELFAPDRKGDPNSTEALLFYDAACSQVAFDDVRLYTPASSSSETVVNTATFYARGRSTPVATATSNSRISNASFGNFGLPNIVHGFSSITSTSVSIGKAHVLSSGAELVMMPGSQLSSTFCEDSAGFDPTGVASLDETFGWQGGILSGGNRTVLSNGAVKWSATPSGSVFIANLGALGIATGKQNTSCPIATPGFTLTGGTLVGTYSLPITVIFQHGLLRDLVVRNGALAGGATLDIRTHRDRQPGNRAFITGTISRGRIPIATIAANSFGSGTLTITSTGTQFKILDWVVAQ